MKDLPLWGLLFFLCMEPVLLFSRETDLLYRRTDPVEMEVDFIQGLLNRGLLPVGEQRAFALLNQKDELVGKYRWKTGSLLLNALGQRWFSDPLSNRKIIEDKIQNVRRILENNDLSDSSGSGDRLFYFYTLFQLCVAQGTVLRIEGDPIRSAQYFDEVHRMIDRNEKDPLFTENERFLFACYRDLAEQDWGFKREDEILQKRILANAEKLKTLIPEEIFFRKGSQANLALMSDNYLEMERNAKTAWNQNHWQDAVALYDQAALLAQQQGNQQDVFRLKGTSAGILDHQYRNQDALSEKIRIAIKKDLALRFYSLGMDYPKEPLSEKMGEYGLDYALELFQTGDVSLDDYVQLRLNWEKRIKDPGTRDFFHLNTVLFLLNHSEKEKAITHLLNGHDHQGGSPQAISEALLNRFQSFRLSLGKHPLFDSIEFRFLEAQALQESGRSQEALNHFAALLKQYPDDLRGSIAIAEILSDQKSEQGLRKALSFWEKVMNRSPRGSDAWWNAKEKMILVYCRLGEKKQAQKIFDLLELTDPEFGNENRKKRFDEIRKKFF